MRNYKLDLRTGILLLLLLSFGVTLNAQQNSTSINGKVLNEYDIPIEGVSVFSGDGQSKTQTDAQGEYLIIIDDENKFLTFSFIDYLKQKVEIDNKKHINVNLVPDENHLEDMINLGYSSQSRGELTGAVSYVSGKELGKSPVANLGMTFAGRLPGLFLQETSSEPGRANTSMYTRGTCANRLKEPIVIIDGIVSSYSSNQSLEYITPSEIESVTLLKDASTEALYGIQGANGVLVITTKQGVPGKLKVNVRFDESFQHTTTEPTFINSAEYATLRNEAAYNDGKGSNYYFSDYQIEKYSSGEDRNLYPNSNWKDKFMKDYGQMQRIGVDLSGGNDKIQYFTNVNCMHQGSQFKTDQADYDTAPNFTWINFRSNLKAKINDYIGAYLHLSGNVKRERTPGSSIFSQTLYTSLFQMPSTVYGPVTPTIKDSVTGNTLGDEVITTAMVGSPTYGMLNRSGYTRHTVTNIYAQFGMNFDLKFLTQGLKSSGVIAYQTNSVNSLYTTKNYERYVRTDDPTTLSFEKKGSDNNTTLSYGKGTGFYYHLTYKGKMDYKRNFGRHEVTALAYAFYDDLSTSSNSSPYCLPYKRLSSGLEATYGYDNRYYLKLDAGYTGSGQYVDDSRFIWTPAVSSAWVVSNEAFMKDVKVLDYLKLRASYGKTANDDDNQGRYIYLDNVTFSGGGSIGDLRFIVNESQTANVSYSPEIIKKQNYGVDLGLFNEFSLSLDVFKEHMDNMVVNAANSVPSYQGISLSNYPVTNVGEYENKGYEVQASFTKNISKNFKVNIGGFMMYAKNKEIYSAEAEKSEDYAFRNRTEGYSYGQSWGYLVDYENSSNGFFNSQSEIDNSGLSYSFGTPRVGDLRYKDLNEDNTIDEKDQAPIGNGVMPRYYYGFSGGFTYKSFDFSFLFQGVAKWSSIYSGIGVYETSYEGVYGSLHRNAWTQERYNNEEEITAPALSLTTSTNTCASDYYEYNRSYLRLKNLVIGYTLPTNISDKFKTGKIRFYLSGQNLFTWDKMKSDDFGPEGNYSTIPVYRVYNAGLSIGF